MDYEQFQETVTKIVEERQDRVYKMKEEFLSFCPTLREHGLSHVVVGYSGSDASGQVNYVELYNNDSGDDVRLEDFEIEHPPYKAHKWPEGEVLVTKGFMSPLFEEWTYDVLEHFHSGWYNAGGADGTVFFLVEDGIIRIKHTNYYTESDYSEDEL